MSVASSYGQILSADPDVSQVDCAAKANYDAKIGAFQWQQTSDANAKSPVGICTTYATGKSFHNSIGKGGCFFTTKGPVGGACIVKQEITKGSGTYPGEPVKINNLIGGVIPPIVPTDHFGRGLDNTQTNWIGPFTHAGAFTCNDPYTTPYMQTGPGGDNWGGGSQWVGGWYGGGVQLYPFPYFYYARFIAGNLAEGARSQTGAIAATDQNMSKYTIDYLSSDAGKGISFTAPCNPDISAGGGKAMLTNPTFNTCELDAVLSNDAKTRCSSGTCSNNARKADKPTSTYSKPKADAMKCLNLNLAKPAIEIAVNICNDAVEQINKGLPPGSGLKKLKASDYYKDSDAIIQIKPSTMGVDDLYKYYNTYTPDRQAEFKKNLSSQIANKDVCLAGMVKGGKLPTFKAVSVAQAWITAVGWIGGDDNKLKAMQDRLAACPAAMIIIAGETDYIYSKADGLRIKNVANGIWQVTSPDALPISGCAFNPKGGDGTPPWDGKLDVEPGANVCCQADFVNTHLYTGVSSMVTSFGPFNTGLGSCNRISWGKGSDPKAGMCSHCKSPTDPSKDCSCNTTAPGGGGQPDGTCVCKKGPGQCNSQPCGTIQNKNVCCNAGSTWGCSWKGTDGNFKCS